MARRRRAVDQDDPDYARPWFRPTGGLVGFVAAIPFAVLLNLVQDWAGKWISGTQTALLCGILLVLAFLVYEITSSASEAARDARITGAKIDVLQRTTDSSFEEFRGRVGTSIKYYPARRGPTADHLEQARKLYQEAGKVIDSAKEGDEIYAVNSFVEIFHQIPQPEVEPLQRAYLKRIEQCIARRVKYHRLIQLESLDALDGDRPLLASRLDPSYLEHYRWVVEQRVDAPGNLVGLNAVAAKYPISFVVLKRKEGNGNAGGSIIWQINEHIQRDGQPEAAHLQLTGIFIIKNPQGDVVASFLDWYEKCNEGRRPLTARHLSTP